MEFNFSQGFDNAIATVKNFFLSIWKWILERITWFTFLPEWVGVVFWLLTVACAILALAWLLKHKEDYLNVKP